MLLSIMAGIVKDGLLNRTTQEDFTNVVNTNLVGNI